MIYIYMDSGFKHILFSRMDNIWDNRSHWRTHMFQDVLFNHQPYIYIYVMLVLSLLGVASQNDFDLTWVFKSISWGDLLEGCAAHVEL